MQEEKNDSAREINVQMAPVNREEQTNLSNTFGVWYRTVSTCVAIISHPYNCSKVRFTFKNKLKMKHLQKLRNCFFGGIFWSKKPGITTVVKILTFYSYLIQLSSPTCTIFSFSAAPTKYPIGQNYSCELQDDFEWPIPVWLRISDCIGLNCKCL